MNNKIHYKNNFQWYSIVKLNVPVKIEIINDLSNIWKNINWGENYENFRRPQHQRAIYPCTRVKHWTPYLTDNFGIIIQKINEKIIDQIKHFFNFEIKISQGELTLLLPEGVVPWHHDRMVQAKINSRLMIPLLNSKNIIYSFSNWSNDTPTDVGLFPAANYLSNKIYQCEIEVGNYYLFNHRVPHSTISHSKLPRAMYSIDFSDNICNILTSAPIDKYELTEILPPSL